MIRDDDSTLSEPSEGRNDLGPKSPSYITLDKSRAQHSRLGGPNRKFTLTRCCDDMTESLQPTLIFKHFQISQWAFGVMSDHSPMSAYAYMMIGMPMEIGVIWMHERCDSCP
jgi:hypothetical protein